MNQQMYQTILRQELAKRCERNPNYSLRAFAKSLGIDPGALSRIMNGIRPLSPKAAQLLGDKLDLDPQTRRTFLQSAVFGDQDLEKMMPQNLEVDLFRVIADWYHIAILELSRTRRFRSDFRWIAKELGISSLEAKLAVERLVDLELLEWTDQKTLRKTQENITTADKNLSTSALRKYQNQVLDKAIESLKEDPIERRNHSSMSLAIDPDRLPEAKRRIEIFTQEITQFLEGGEKKEVYQMALCLFPLQTSQNRKGTQS